MKIVIEGVNGSGKSYLCHQLAKEFNLKTHHPGPKPPSDEAAIGQCIEQVNLSDVIMDRSTMISRVVYGDNNEDPNGLLISHVDEIEGLRQILINQGTIFIHTIGKGEHQLKSYYSAFHVKMITMKHQELRDRYMAVFNHIPHIVYDFKRDSLKGLITQIRRRHDDSICTSVK